MNEIEFRLLQRLARHHNIQTSYTDMRGKCREALPESLQAVLGAMGVAVQPGQDIRESLRHAEQGKWKQPLEPVTVLWAGRKRQVPFRAHGAWRPQGLKWRVVTEEGAESPWTASGKGWSRLKETRIDSELFVLWKFPLPHLPLGCHELQVETPDELARSMLIAAPRRCYAEPNNPTWGIFAPMYAVYSQQSWGAGNVTDWQQFCDWTASFGGQVVGTLPLLPVFLDRPFEPSPYSPVSRLFWNEFYLDVTRVPELSNCQPAQKLLRTTPFTKTLQRLRQASQVDYRAEMQLKRQVLELLCEFFFSHDSPHRHEFRQWLQHHPQAEDYARFRATGEQAQAVWQQWPDRLRNGQLRKGDYSERSRDYHLYVQWLMQTQINEVLSYCRTRQIKFYLDLPVGVSPDGYDMWRYQKSFSSDASVGAPPDIFFTKGQDWGFAPLDPEALRAEHYEYVLRSLRFQMRHTGLLRLDHVMGLHRLYWIPKGMPASAGAYVRYPAEELYALLCLESHRHHTTVVGENLGTVPPEVNRSMAQHGLRKMFVLQYEVSPKAAQALPPPGPDTVASLNTHDMPPFAAFWEGEDIDDRAALGLVKKNNLKQEHAARDRLTKGLTTFLRRQGWLKSRNPQALEVFQAALAFLGRSRSELVLVNLEDLWAETLPQNVPGTSHERPNWRRKARFGLEEFNNLPEVSSILAQLSQLRQAAKGKPKSKTGPSRRSGKGI